MIRRDPESAARSEYDLVVIGGGVHGAFLLLEAAARGMRTLLLERDDFGGATTWNSLRIIHGGFRYLQHANLKRYFESVAERRWFLNTFPDLVEPLPCLMPLYGDGLKRPAVLRAALLCNELLGASRGVRDDQWRRGRVLSALDTLAVAPFTQMNGLRGAAMWCDAVMTSSQRVLIEAIKWACSAGGRALNYMEAMEVKIRSGAVQAVGAIDRTTHREHQFATRAVANCAGPWARNVAQAIDRDVPRLFRPSLAYNLLLDREPLSQFALALSPRRQDCRSDRMYVLKPFRGRILAGTAHWPWREGEHPPRPTHEQVSRTLNDLNAAVPELDLSHDDVLRVFCGLLPATRSGSDHPAGRVVVHDHGRFGGPRGLVSVSGVKFTTARRVARRVLKIVNAHRSPVNSLPPRSLSPLHVDLLEPDDLLAADAPRATDAINRLVREESVVQLDDLLLRRTDWLVDPRNAERVTQRVSSLVDIPDSFDRSASQSPALQPTLHQ